MHAPRFVLTSASLAAIALAGVQLGSSASAAPLRSTAAVPGTITLQLPASPYPSQKPPPPPVLTIGTPFTFEATVPSNGTAYTGTLDLDVNALAALDAADLTVTATPAGGTAQSVPLSNDTAAGGDATDASGSVAISVPATGGETTTFSMTATSATGVRGQIGFFLEFDASDGTDEADNASLDNLAQVPRATPEQVLENVALFRPSTRSIYYGKANTAGGGGAVQLISGRSGDQLLTGDAFGSGDSYPVEYRPSTSTFYFADGFEEVAGNAIGVTDYGAIHFGRSGDIPLVGAFPDSDKLEGSLDTVAVYRPSNETFYVLGGAPSGLHFGTKGDKPLVGNWTGTKDTEGDAGGDSIGVFRPSNHTFYLLTLSGSVLSKTFGRSTDKPVVGDWGGNGTSVVGVDRDNVFYLAKTNTASAATYPAFAFGAGSDQPLAAYVSTPTDLTDIATVTSSDPAVVAKTTATRRADRVAANGSHQDVSDYPRGVAPLVIR